MTKEDAVEKSQEDINNFLKAIETQNFVQAERHFSDMITDRINTTIDQEKARVASQIFGDPEEYEDEEEEVEEDEEIDDDEFTDEELLAAMQELEDEEEEDEE